MKYIVDLPKEYISGSSLFGKILSIPIQINGNKNFNIPTSIKITPYTEPDRKAIEDAQEEAWEMASKCLWDIENSQSRVIFGKDCVYVPRDMTYQEAKAKYESWKAEKAEIRVGYEVEYPPNKAKGIVVQCHVPDVYAEVDKYAVFTGTSVEYLPIEWLTKTGRVFPEVAELLKKMREE